jgi:hypothetical protein
VGGGEGLGRLQWRLEEEWRRGSGVVAVSPAEAAWMNQEVARRSRVASRSKGRSRPESRSVERRKERS